MQRGRQLQFQCQSCQSPIRFSVFDIDDPIICSECEKKYLFHDETLKRQLRKFEALCQQIVESEEILSDVSVGIDVGDRHVQIPYKLLLTRLNSHLELTIGNQPVSIEFRMEPLEEVVTTHKG